MNIAGAPIISSWYLLQKGRDIYSSLYWQTYSNPSSYDKIEISEMIYGGIAAFWGRSA